VHLLVQLVCKSIHTARNVLHNMKVSKCLRSAKLPTHALSFLNS
jgi:hypothetical protein